MIFKYDKKLCLIMHPLNLRKAKYTEYLEEVEVESQHFNILLGLIKAEKIKLQYNQIDWNRKTIYFFNKKIGFVSQNQTILDDTIKNNIAFGLDDNQINEKIINIICEKQNWANSLRSFNKINSRIGEFGSKIRRSNTRLLISRALYNNPDILILDEPTSSLTENWR